MSIRYLDIVIEDEMALAVLCEQVKSVVVCKVLELDQDLLAVVLLDSIHELFKKRMVFLATMKRTQKLASLQIIQNSLTLFFSIMGADSLTFTELKANCAVPRQ
jgi:hypothetical protein